LKELIVNRYDKKQTNYFRSEKGVVY